MKSWLAMPLLVVLQFALSPLCLCQGMSGVDTGAATSSCCHHEAPREAPDSTDHCPHCDVVESFHLASPAKAAAAPDGVGVELPTCPIIGSSQPPGQDIDELVAGVAEPGDPVPWRHSVRAILAVFLI